MKPSKAVFILNRVASRVVMKNYQNMNSVMNDNFVLTGAVVSKFGALDFKPQF